MNKKGFIGDILTFALILFALAIVIVIASYVFTTINTAWQASDFPTESKDIINKQSTRFVGVWDAFMVFAIIGYAIAIIILANSIKSHPMFAMLGFIVMVVLGIVGAHLANAYYAFASSSEIASTANNFTLTAFIMQFLPYIIIGVGIMFIIILYAKQRSQSII